MGTQTMGINGWVLATLVLVILAAFALSCYLAEYAKHKATRQALEDVCTGIMTMNMYQVLAMRTAMEQLPKDAADHALFGLCSEVGELATHWKAHRYYGKPLDRDYMRKELGDVLWFLSRAAAALELRLDDVAETNIEKLRLRYPERFTRAAALARADEVRT